MGHEGRESWSNPLEFALTILGSSGLGLGSIWRFPYLCGRNGGAVFMIPYMVVMLLIGLPMFYLEIATGQFAQVTPALLSGRIAPIGKGLGMLIMSAELFTCFYYNTLNAWSLHYAANCFRAQLLWSHCSNDYNTFRCFDEVLAARCITNNETYYAGQCVDEVELDDKRLEIEVNWEQSVLEKYGEIDGLEFKVNFTKEYANLTGNPLTKRRLENIFELTGRTSAPREYLYIRMLRLAPGIEPRHFGYPQWDLVLSLLGAWFLVFLCLMFGTATLGKVTYLTTTMPYVILLILLVRGMTLGPGVKDGLLFFLVPKTSKLLESRAWSDAANQVLFSLGLGSGEVMSMASYNSFHNNFFQNTIIVVAGNLFSSFFAGLVTFPVVGFMAHEQGVPVEDLAKEGISMAYQVYPQALNRLALPQLWSFLFFAMLIMLGFTTQLVMTENLITAFLDTIPWLRKPVRKIATVALVCLSGFLVGLVYTCPGGPYLLSLMDNYGGGWPLLVSCLLQIILVMYIYGIRNFHADVRLMLGEPPNRVWRLLGYPYNVFWNVCWMFLTPVLILVIIIFNLSQFSRSTYDSTYVYPVWADVLGWLITLTCVSPAFFAAAHELIWRKRKGLSIRKAFLPTDDWGPMDKTHAVPGTPPPVDVGSENPSFNVDETPEERRPSAIRWAPTMPDVPEDPSKAVDSGPDPGCPKRTSFSAYRRRVSIKDFSLPLERGRRWSAVGAGALMIPRKEIQHVYPEEAKVKRSNSRRARAQSLKPPAEHQQVDSTRRKSSP